MTRRFLDLADAGADGLRDILAEAKRRKTDRAGWPKGRPDADRSLDGHALACVFEKPSTRTRLSFDMAMRQLGGQTLVMGTSDMQLGRGETVADTARVLSRMVDAVMVRANAHADVVELADNASIPVINGLTDRSHPCQVVADLMTVEERLGRIAGTTWAWLGDGNNVAHSIVEAGSLLGFEVRFACPAGHGPARDVLDAARWRGGRTVLTESAEEAVAGADVVVTDTWISMGQDDSAAKIAAMQPYQVTEALMRLAAEKAMFLHCLPAHRGEEVVESVIDGPISAVWDEAENRLHAQKAILLWCLERI